MNIEAIHHAGRAWAARELWKCGAEALEERWRYSPIDALMLCDLPSAADAFGQGIATAGANQTAEEQWRAWRGMRVNGPSPAARAFAGYLGARWVDLAEHETDFDRPATLDRMGNALDLFAAGWMDRRESYGPRGLKWVLRLSEKGGDAAGAILYPEQRDERPLMPFPRIGDYGPSTVRSLARTEREEWRCLEIRSVWVVVDAAGTEISRDHDRSQAIEAAKVARPNARIVDRPRPNR